MRNSFCSCANNDQIITIGTKNSFKIKSCKICGHGYVSNEISNKFLEDYYANARQDENYRDDLSKQSFPESKSDALKFIKLFKKHKKIFQVFWK